MSKRTALITGVTGQGGSYLAELPQGNSSCARRISQEIGYEEFLNRRTLLHGPDSVKISEGQVTAYHAC